MASDTTLVDVSRLPRLVVRVGRQVVQELPLPDALSIGRGEDNDLKLADPKASRHHARVEKQGGSFVLTDVGSANGTWVRGARLVAPHTLKSGEPFTIGDTELIYLEPGQEAGDASEPVPVLQVTSPELTAAPPARPRGTNRGLAIALIAAGTVLILALAVLLLYLFAPGALERIGLLPHTTATAVATSPTAATPTGPAQDLETPSAAVPPTSVASPVASQEFLDQLAQANSLALRSRFEEAIAIYQSLAQSAPADARPEIGWAWALIYDDQADQALAHAQKAVELDPANADAATVLARAYVDMGDKGQALALAEKAVQLAPGGAEAHAVLAEAYRLNGQYEEAVREADLALIQDNSSANARRARAWLYQAVDNDLARTVSTLQGTAGLQPQLWLRRHELGLALLDAQNYGIAILAFQDALAMRPKAVTYAGLGEAYFGLEQYEQAAVSLRQAIAMGLVDAHAYALMALADAHLARCDEAQAYAQEALALDPAEPQALEAQQLCQEGRATPQATRARPTAAITSTPRATPKPTSPAAPLTGQMAFPVWNALANRVDTYMAQAKDGSGRHLVIEAMHQPALSPDGKWLALNGEQPERTELFVIKPDGTSLTKITVHIEDGQPAWSPDGKKLAFSSNRHGDKRWRIYIIDDVPSAEPSGEWRTLNFGPDDIRGQMPAWTSDDRIVYRGCAMASPRNTCNGEGLYVMSAAPGVQTPRQLTTLPGDTAPSVHGDKIAFMSDSSGNWEIYIMPLPAPQTQWSPDALSRVKLTDSPSIDGLPVWSPDGKTIAFLSNQGGVWAIWAINPDGSNRRKLFDLGGGGLPSDWQTERISWGP